MSQPGDWNTAALTGEDGRGRGGHSPTLALELRGVTKRYGSVLACRDVDLAVRAGQIHGLLGQNGAGKSTLMNILLGLVSRDAGTIRIKDRPVAVSDPLEAAAEGLAMVHQHFSLVGPMTVWENVTLGERGRIDPRGAARRIAETAERYGLVVDPRARVHDLTTGQRQRVELVKCLMKNPDVLILDEPTSVLTVQESFDLFKVLREVVREENKAVILISHKLDEILYATDRVTIMRGGAVVAESATRDTDAHGLAREMIGREVSLGRADAAVGHVGASVSRPARPGVGGTAGSQGVEEAGSAKSPSLSIHEAVAVAPDGRRWLDGLSLEVRSGEIVGLAGVEGNGQRALGDLLASLVELQSGVVEVAGRVVATGHPGRMLAAGVAVITEDRHATGCVLDMSVAENLVLGQLGGVCHRGFVRRGRVRRIAEELVEEFDIKVASIDAPMRSLSGGNQQKVVLAREMGQKPRVLVAAQPTRGLDVGAIEYMNGRLRSAASAGVGVLLISTELEEILHLADRVAVIHRGQIIGEMPREDATLDRIGLLMGGRAA